MCMTFKNVHSHIDYDFLMYLKNLFCGVEDTTKAPILNVFE